MLLAWQDEVSAGMAARLESLAAHYEQLATALREKEVGTELEDADMEGASCAGACGWHAQADVCVRQSLCRIRQSCRWWLRSWRRWLCASGMSRAWLSAFLRGVLSKVQRQDCGDEVCTADVPGCAVVHPGLARRAWGADGWDAETAEQHRSECVLQWIFLCTLPTALQLETQAMYETLNDYLDSLLTLRST